MTPITMTTNPDARAILDSAVARAREARETAYASYRRTGSIADHEDCRAATAALALAIRQARYYDEIGGIDGVRAMIATYYREIGPDADAMTIDEAATGIAVYDDETEALPMTLIERVIIEESDQALRGAIVSEIDRAETEGIGAIEVDYVIADLAGTPAAYLRDPRSESYAIETIADVAREYGYDLA